MKIGVVAKKNKVKDETTVVRLVDFLRGLGYSTTVCADVTQIDEADVFIVLGGDGAILHSAVYAARLGVKIIGINYGNLGFLTEYEKDEWQEIKELLAQLEKNECRIVKRSLLQIQAFGKTYFALNEVALQRDYANKQPTQIMRVNVETNEGKDVIAGDGVLICTPTGSTAYSLSAGGAILTPEVPVFMLTPVCAFSMRRRPTVFSDNEIFKLSIQRGRSLLLIDGRAIGVLGENDEVCVQKAPFTADFPVRNGAGFFNKVRNKLSE
jgi:NAD+ kinase